METVFAIPELLALIAEAADQKQTLSAISQTSKSMNDAALDALWSDLDSIKPLVMLLGPVIYAERQNPFSTAIEYAWDYQDPYISSERWARFKYYHRRVRRLQIALNQPIRVRNQQSYPFGPSLLSLLAVTRPFHDPLLPNLRSVSVTGRTIDAFIYSLPFLNENVQHLKLVASKLNNTMMGYVLREFTCRLPNLHTVSLESDGAGATFELSLVEFIKGLQHPSVTQISLPRQFLTTNVLAELSQVTSLEKISTYYHGSPTGTVAPISLDSLKQKGFSELTKLAIAMPLDSILPLVIAKDRAPKLKDIEVWSPNTSNMQLEDFSKAIMQYWSNITALRLDLFHPTFSPTVPVEFRMLLPLLECQGMTSFFLRHRLAVRMDSDDLMELLSHWSKLISLSITPDPVQGIAPASPGLPISVLNLIAQLCPEMEHIGLFFDTSSSSSWSPHLRLERIKLLHVGWTKPEQPHEIALFLAGICHQRMGLLVGDSLITPSVNANATSPHVAQWQEVERLFKTLAKQRERTLAEVSEMQTARKPGWSQKTDAEDTLGFGV